MAKQRCPVEGCKQELEPYTGTGNPHKVGKGWCPEHGRQPLAVEEAPAEVTAAGPATEETKEEARKPKITE